MRKMVNSTIEWVGEMPAGWKKGKILSFFFEGKIKNRTLAEQNLLSLSYGKIVKKDINASEGLLPASFATYNIVEKNDIIIRPTDLQNDKHSLRTGLVEERGIITSAYIDLKPFANTNSNFFHKLLHTYDLCKVFYNMGNGVRQCLGYIDMAKLDILVPPLAEQKAIADFLDKKCGEIDEISEIIESQIEALENYKKSIITETTSRGLNSTVEMTDSGIQWVGSIPKHWNVLKGKYCFINDKEVVGARVDDFERLALTLNGVIKRSKEDNTGLQPEKFNTYQILRKDELVFKLIDLQNVSTSRVGLSPYEGIVSGAYIILRAKENINPHFAEKYYLSMWMNQIFNYLGDAGVRSSLNVDDLLEIQLPVPPLAEQKAIADFLDKKCGEIDEISESKRQQLKKIEEYKKSIVYEYVTGKKEVAYE